jgi:ABC-type glutathione transport system ATPase component
MKKNINFELKSDASKTFRCIKAANSVDLDLEKKLVHHMNIELDFPDEWNIGLIVGASGSGKTTLAKHLYGEECFETMLICQNL